MGKEKSLLLGDVAIEKKYFLDIDYIFERFYHEEFKKLPDRYRSELVNQGLLELIQKENVPCFLLSSVLDYIERIDKERILYHYTFTSFELWLNQFSNLNFDENMYIRGKIAGKWLPRDVYQILFPIGMDKVYSGTHFVTAHKSPDLDTTISSFWGWLDSFAARVGDGLHIWNLPGGPPNSLIEINMIFKEIFGAAVFSHLVKTRNTLTLTGNDMMTQMGMIKKTGGVAALPLEHERQNKAIVFVDEEGFYLGDWRSMDVEGVRQVIMFVNSTIRWFENNLHVKVVSLFAQEEVFIDEISSFIQKVFNLTFQDAEPVKELSSGQRDLMDHFLKKVLLLDQGLDASFKDFGQSLSTLSIFDFINIEKTVDSIKQSNLFDIKGILVENRPRIFLYIEKIVKGLHTAVQKIRQYMERLEVAFLIKTKVFGYLPKFVSVRADIEEMRSKMGSYQHLTVTYPDQGRSFPVGIVKASDLRKQVLGTVSLRDFCNSHEITIPSYLEVISIVDHHKAVLDTLSPSMTYISDAQASNSLVAELAFSINDKYSMAGMGKEEILSQLNDPMQPDSLKKRLIQKKIILENNHEYFIDPQRELIEYTHFLYGILDDTDLLMKVSFRDIESVASLLNRLKSLVLKKEVEIISLEDIKRDKNFVKTAAKRILQNEDMYSLYKKVYLYREKDLENHLKSCAEGKSSIIFSDTKEQNGCSRVGQTKLFFHNIPTFNKYEKVLQEMWVKESTRIAKERPEIDLYLQMVSTISGAKEVFKGQVGNYTHKDQLWIWIPPTDLGIEHLKRFLNALQGSIYIQNNDLSVAFLGENAEDLSLAFTESFIKIPQEKRNLHLPIAVLYYNAGTMNSRKSMISPYLPTLVS